MTTPAICYAPTLPRPGWAGLALGKVGRGLPAYLHLYLPYLGAQENPCVSGGAVPNPLTGYLTDAP